MQTNLDGMVGAILAEQALLLRQMGDADKAVDAIMNRRATAAHLSSTAEQSAVEVKYKVDRVPCRA